MDICQDIKHLIYDNLQEILSLRNTGSLKPDGTFVSQGDLLSQKIVLSYLKSHLSDYFVISEESNCNFTNVECAEYVITVDPIDGTENFVSGLKEWGIGISVYRNMKHFQSMILMPELDLCLMTGQKLQRISSSRICGLSSYMTPSDFETLDAAYEYRIMGCCMYNMYNVIYGCYAQFQHLKGCYSWDILPGMNLALEHNLCILIDDRDYKGEFLLPGIKYKFLVKGF